MTSLLPIISMSALQKNARAALAGIEDFAVIQSHGHDRAFVLHPELGKILLHSGMLEALRKQWSENRVGDKRPVGQQLEQLIGNVLRELSRK